jgi:hypothetical protein
VQQKLHHRANKEQGEKSMVLKGLTKQRAPFSTRDQQKRAKRQAFLIQMRADWGSHKIWYSGPLLSIGSYVPTLAKLSVVSTVGPLLFLPKPIQVTVLEIDDDGWVRLMVGFDRRDQPIYRYVKAEVLQKYGRFVEGE